MKNRLVGAAALASSLAISVLVLATNPADQVGYAMLFFLFLLVFFISFGYLAYYRFRAEMTARARYRILILSIFLVILIMFRSAQSLGWVDGLVLAAVTAGLLFYSGRRA